MVRPWLPAHQASPFKCSHMPAVYLVDEGIQNPDQVLNTVPEDAIGLRIDRSMAVPFIARLVIDSLYSLATPSASSSTSSRRSGVTPGRATQPTAPLITDFRIMCHGDSGRLYLGRGVDARNAAQLVPLRQHIRPGLSSRCLLLGCNVASNSHSAERDMIGTPTGNRVGTVCTGWGQGESNIRAGAGYALLSTLARTLGTSVTAGLDTQSSARDWQFLGATMTVDPFGQIRFTGMDMPTCVEMRSERERAWSGGFRP